MIEKFAGVCDMVLSEFLDLNHTSNSMNSSVPYDFEVRSQTPRRAPANFEIGTLVA
jgi:hypothetical protein